MFYGGASKVGRKFPSTRAGIIERCASWGAHSVLVLARVARSFEAEEDTNCGSRILEENVKAVVYIAPQVGNSWDTIRRSEEM